MRSTFTFVSKRDLQKRSDILYLGVVGTKFVAHFLPKGAWPGRWQAPERGGVRLPRQAEAGGTSHRHPVSGPRGCRALLPHFPRCSLGALRRSGAAMASGEAASAGAGRCVAAAARGGWGHLIQTPGEWASGLRALPPHFLRCSLGAFRLRPVRSDARVPSLPQLWVPQSCCWAAQYLKRLRCLPAPTFDCWASVASAADDLYWLWGSSHCDYWPFSSTFSAAAGATELLRGWKVAQKIALFALSSVAE